MNKRLISKLLDNHAIEQLYKNGLPQVNKKYQDDIYKNILSNNLKYIINYANRDSFIGEKNIGIYTNRLIDSLKIPSIETRIIKLKKDLGIPKKFHVPVCSEDDYFSHGYLYTMQYHNTNQPLVKYAKKAIQQGYWHPREFASFFYNMRRLNNSAKNIYIDDYSKNIIDTKVINTMRDSLLLPSYEIDFAKHEFAHEHNLMLSFGFFYCAK